MSLSEARLQESAARRACVRLADRLRGAREWDSVRRSVLARQAMEAERELAWAEATRRSIEAGA